MIAGSQLSDSVFLLLKRRWDERKNNFIVNACSGFNKLYLMPRMLTMALGWFMAQTLVLLGFKMLIMLRHLDMMQMEEWTRMIQWPLLVYVTNFRSDATGGMDGKYMAGKKKKASNMLKIFDNQKTWFFYLVSFGHLHYGILIFLTFMIMKIAVGFPTPLHIGI